MSVIAMPTTLRIGAVGIGQARYDLVEMSDASGSQASRLFGPPRWRLSLTSPPSLTLAQAAVWEALLLQLRGGINHLSAWDPVRVQPAGTMRGTLTLSGSHAAGATSITVTGGGSQALTTLKAGDWLQIGVGIGTSQLVKVMADSVANGSGVITGMAIEPPLRIAFSTATAVAWDRPIAYYKQGGTPQWAYGAGRTQTGFAIDALESWG
jgi:hypothetical protein